MSQVSCILLYLEIKAFVMNRLPTIAICCFMLLTAACSKEKTTIEYPAEGFYGPNILTEGRTKYPKYAQMEANLGKENSLKIIISGVSGYLRRDTFPNTNPPQINTRLIGAWGLSITTTHNLAISNFEQEPFRQTFQSIETNGKILLNMKFEEGHSYRLDIYENGATQPSRTKIMEVE